MRPLNPFEYFEPRTLAEAVQNLHMYGERAKVLAGGVDLVPKMRQRKIKPECVVSLQGIPGLDYIESDGIGLRIGALTTLRSIELSPLIHKNYRILYEAIQGVASIQVKNMGTAVGNLCVATPASDVAPPLYVLGAKLRITSVVLERIISIEDFFTGVSQTVLQPGEIIIEILLPRPSTESGGAFLKLVRTADDIAKVNVAVMVRIRDGICDEAKVAVGSVASTVIRAKKSEETLKGKKLAPKVIELAAEAAAEEISPITDIRSTVEYRKEMTKILVGRAVEKAIDRARI